MSIPFINLFCKYQHFISALLSPFQLLAYNQFFIDPFIHLYTMCDTHAYFLLFILLNKSNILIQVRHKKITVYIFANLQEIQILTKKSISRLL